MSSTDLMIEAQYDPVEETAEHIANISNEERPSSAKSDVESERGKENTEVMKQKMNLGVHRTGFTVYREAIRSGESCRGMPSLAVEAMKATTLQFDPKASRKQALVRIAYVPVHHHVIRYLEGLDGERIEGESAPSVVGRPLLLHQP